MAPFFLIANLIIAFSVIVILVMLGFSLILHLRIADLKNAIFVVWGCKIPVLIRAHLKNVTCEELT